MIQLSDSLRLVHCHKGSNRWQLQQLATASGSHKGTIWQRTEPLLSDEAVLIWLQQLLPSPPHLGQLRQQIRQNDRKSH